MNVKEQDIQSAILHYLAYRPVYVFKNNNTGIKKPNGSYIPSPVKGVSDILGVHYGTGKFIAIEVKRPGNKPTPAQLEFLEKIKAAGGIAILAYSVDDVRAIL